MRYSDEYEYVEMDVDERLPGSLEGLAVTETAWRRDRNQWVHVVSHQLRALVNMVAVDIKF